MQMRLPDETITALRCLVKFHEIVDQPASQLDLPDLEMKRGYLIGMIEETWYWFAHDIERWGITGQPEQDELRQRILWLAVELGRVDLRRRELQAPKRE